GHDARHLGGVRIATVGSATAEALRTFGLTSDLSPERATSWDLGVALVARASSNARILLPRGDLTDDALPTALEQSGLTAHRLLTYNTVAPAGLGMAFQDALVDGVDAVIFTSPSTVNNLAAALGNNADRLAASEIVSIGPTTTRAVRDAGWAVAIEADVPTDRGIVDALVARAQWGPSSTAS
ncbi:MAG: uroporphyrinogen-III synthase, partial [Chloroflexi bacterium]|nr:uroporphyrinogen-III synthase [Chloroflexota bacterium]